MPLTTRRTVLAAVSACLFAALPGCHTQPATAPSADNVPKLDKKRPTILFTHFPLGFLTPARPRNADDVLDPFKDLNLRAVFNGHYHGYTERTRWNATITTDKCCSFHHANHDGTKEKGYFVCQAKGGVVERGFVEVKVA